MKVNKKNQAIALALATTLISGFSVTANAEENLQSDTYQVTEAENQESIQNTENETTEQEEKNQQEENNQQEETVSQDTNEVAPLSNESSNEIQNATEGGVRSTSR